MASGGLHHQYKARDDTHQTNLNLRYFALGNSTSENRLIHFVSSTKMIIKCIAELMNLSVSFRTLHPWQCSLIRNFSCERESIMEWGLEPSSCLLANRFTELTLFSPHNVLNLSILCPSPAFFYRRNNVHSYPSLARQTLAFPSLKSHDHDQVECFTIGNQRSTVSTVGKTFTRRESGRGSNLPFAIIFYFAHA